jgi:hypothetical protein
MSKPSSARTTRQWWCYDSDRGTVRQVTGYDCLPEYPDYWWCPEVGYSAQEGTGLFATEREALEASMQALRSRISALQRQWHALWYRRGELLTEEGRHDPPVT